MMAAGSLLRVRFLIVTLLVCSLIKVLTNGYAHFLQHGHKKGGTKAQIQAKVSMYMKLTEVMHKLQLNKPDMHACTEKTLKEYCRNSLYNKTLLDFRSRDTTLHFSKVHLLITLNKPFWQIVPLVDSLYCPFFPNITFCSVTGNRNETERLEKRGYSLVTYKLPRTDTKIGNGWLAYRCWIELVERGYLSSETMGVLGIADDQIISPSELGKLNLNAIWRLKSDKTYDLKRDLTCSNGRCSSTRNWMWWGPKYVPMYSGALREIRKRAARGEQPYRECHEQLVRVTGGELRMVGGHTADIYYIPRRHLLQYTTLLKTFFKHLVFVEAAVTTAHACIENVTETQRLDGRNIWTSARSKQPWVNFRLFKDHKTRKHFYHPVKWSPLLESNNPVAVSNYTNFLCKSVLPFLHPPLHRTVLHEH